MISIVHSDHCFLYFFLVFLNINASANYFSGSLLLNLPWSGKKIFGCLSRISLSIYRFNYRYPEILDALNPKAIEGRKGPGQQKSSQKFVTPHSCKDAQIKQN